MADLGRLAKMKKIAIGVVLVVGTILVITQVRFSRLRETYIRTMVQQDYQMLVSVVTVLRADDPMFLDALRVVGGSRIECSPGRVVAELKFSLPKDPVARGHALQLLVKCRPACAIDSTYFYRGRVSFGETIGDSWMYSWDYAY